MSEPDLDPIDLPPVATQRPRRSLTAATAALIIVMVVAAIVGFAVTSRVRAEKSFDTASADEPQANGRPRTRPPAASVPSSDPDAAVLRSLGVQQQDIGTGNAVALITNGDSVVGTTTLDLCNGTYPSEKLRTARFQVVEIDPLTPIQASSVLSTEPVLYKTPSAGAQAIAEVRRVAAACPKTPVVSPVGSTTVTTTFLAAPDGSWPHTPGVERAAFHFDTANLQGTKSQSIAVYLRRGRAFIGVYFPSPDGAQPAVAGKTTVKDIVGVFEARLAALPESVVNRGG